MLKRIDLQLGFRTDPSLACDERVLGVSFDSFGLLMYLVAILKARALVMGSALASRMLVNTVSTNNKVLFICLSY